MKGFTNFIQSLYLSALPFIGLNIIGIVLLNDLKGYLGLTICLGIFIASLLLSRFIYRTVRKRGGIQFMASIQATPDLDNHLAATESRLNKKRKPAELATLINNKEQLFKGGSISIFGDNYGRHGDFLHRFERAEFTKEKGLLTFYLDTGQVIKIFEPKQIIDATTYLKVGKAKAIRFELSNDEDPIFLEYTYSRGKISYQSNNSAIEDQIDVSLSAPALEIS
tara:strand:+ start:77 stop:745 length:669 start_codon:yes stop_codon:yes gene_type:complete